MESERDDTRDHERRTVRPVVAFAFSVKDIDDLIADLRAAKRSALKTGSARTVWRENEAGGVKIRIVPRLAECVS